MADDSGRTSDRLLEQRVRNRLIEYFELTSSFEAQTAYERVAPIVHVPYEVINQWEDWTYHLVLALDASTVYTETEKKALRQFQVVWERTADALTDDYPPLDVVQTQPAWQDLRRCASEALAVFGQRGRLPEDREVF